MGKFVLIEGDRVVDVFTAYENAIKSGYQNFGLQPFLVRQISAVDPMFYASRFVAPRPGL